MSRIFTASPIIKNITVNDNVTIHRNMADFLRRQGNVNLPIFTNIFNPSTIRKGSETKKFVEIQCVLRSVEINLSYDLFSRLSSYVTKKDSIYSWKVLCRHTLFSAPLFPKSKPSFSVIKRKESFLFAFIGFLFLICWLIRRKEIPKREDFLYCITWKITIKRFMTFLNLVIINNVVFLEPIFLFKMR